MFWGLKSAFKYFKITGKEVDKNNVDRTLWQFFRWLNMELPYGPAIPQLGLYLRNENMSTQKLLHEC